MSGFTWQTPDNDADAAAVERRQITLVGDSLPETLDALEQSLVEQQVGIFNRNGQLVRMVYGKVEVRGGTHEQHVILGDLDARALIEYATRAAKIEKWDGRKKRNVPVNCPFDLAQSYLARRQWGLRPLTGIINAPTLRSDGSLLDKPGYDRAIAVIYQPRLGAVFPAIDPAPSLADARAALSVLDSLICKFPFEAPAHRSVALAAMLTGVIRRSLPTAPLFGFDAEAPGAGKGLLCDTVSTIAIGTRAASITQSNEEETEKRLSAALMRGHGAIVLDNVSKPLGGDALDSILTTPVADLRVLGSSVNVSCPTNTLLMATGNNMTPIGDTTRRVLKCRIDTGVDNPERRRFDFSPLEMVERDRGAYVVACLTILLAYQAAGSPMVTDTAMGSFEAWSRRVRDALVWVGEADPLDVQADIKFHDPVREQLSAVLQAWDAEIGADEVPVKELIQRAMQSASPLLLDALAVVAGGVRYGERIDSKRLGDWLLKHHGRVVDGLRVMPGGERRGSRLWCLQRAVRDLREGEGSFSSSSENCAAISHVVAEKSPTTPQVPQELPPW